MFCLTCVQRKRELENPFRSFFSFFNLEGFIHGRGQGLADVWLWTFDSDCFPCLDTIEQAPCADDGGLHFLPFYFLIYAPVSFCTRCSGSGKRDRRAWQHQPSTIVACWFKLACTVSINSNVTAARRSIRGTLPCDSSGGVQAFWLKLCTQSHILNSGSREEFLVKTREFGGRKLPDVSQVSSSARSSLSVRSESVFTAAAFT